MENKEYNQPIFGNAEDYLEIEGKEIRLAIVKANYLYYTIGEARTELEYVKDEYYKDRNDYEHFYNHDHMIPSHFENYIKERKIY